MSQKKAALVTGAAKRIGREIALHLAAEGYDIGLHFNSSEPEAAKVADEIRAKGVACSLLKADLADGKQVAELAENMRSQLPHWDVLINNASIFEKCDFAGTDEKNLRRHFAINFDAPLFLTQSFAKTQKQGMVINMLDSYSERHNGSYFAYLLSKKALKEFTLMAARALAPKIHVNGIMIGITTLSENLPKEFIARMERELPDKRLVPPSEIAAMAAMALKNPSLNGQFLYADAGHHVL